MSQTQKIWLPENKEGIIVKIVAFLISPVLGMFSALVRPNTKSSYIILFLSLVTIGMAINIPDDRTEEMNFDSIAYRAEFEDYIGMSANDYKSVISNYSQMGEDGATDLYSNTLYFFVTRFSENYHICFLFVSIVFAFFMLKTTRYLVAEDNYHFSVLCLLLLFLFTMAQIGKINMFRFYTAFWVALYAIFKIVLDKDRRYWLLLAITPAIHGSFFLVFLIYALYWFMHDKLQLSVTILIFGFLFSSIAVQVFSWIILHLPESLGGHYSDYINEWYMSEINEGGAGYKWLARLIEFLMRISVNAIGLFFAYHYKTRIAETKCKPLFFFLMAVLAFVDFAIMIPDVGSRYLMFVFPLIAYIWLVCFAKESRWNWIIYPFAGLYLLIFLVLPWGVYRVPCLHYYFELWDADVLYQNPIYLWFKYALFPPA